MRDVGGALARGDIRSGWAPLFDVDGILVTVRGVVAPALLILGAGAGDGRAEAAALIWPDGGQRAITGRRSICRWHFDGSL